MNKKNILKVADAIERGRVARKRLGFNMATWADDGKGGPATPDRSGHNCGTVACIGGWVDAVRLRTTDACTIMDADSEGTVEFLGITQDQAANLFFPRGFSGGKHTPAQAVRVLRHLAETGEVDWSKGGAP